LTPPPFIHHIRYTCICW